MADASAFATASFLGKAPAASTALLPQAPLAVAPAAVQAVGGQAESSRTGAVALAAGVSVGAIVALRAAAATKRRSGRKQQQHRRAQGGEVLCRAAAVQAPAPSTSEPPVVDAEVEEPIVMEEVVACPVCQGPLTTSANCLHCSVSYPKYEDGNFLDLTVTASQPLMDAKAIVVKAAEAPSVPDGVLQKLPGVAQLDGIAKALKLPTSSDVEGLARDVVRDASKVIPRSGDGVLSVTTFQSPLVSFAYERGWRQQFQVNGFPGPEEEYKFAKAFLEGALKKREATTSPVLLDCSCGSGLFTRRFAGDADLAFDEVIALDFSESMLRQTDTYAAREAGANYSSYPRPLRLVRGDVGRLPFRTGSLAGVHASAAIHCWPAPEIALAELARVLEPGAAIVLSTFRPAVLGGSRGRFGGSVGFSTWTEESLRKLTRQVGLLDFEAIQRDPAFIMIKATKPLTSELPKN